MTPRRRRLDITSLLLLPGLALHAQTTFHTSTPHAVSATVLTEGSGSAESTIAAIVRENETLAYVDALPAFHTEALPNAPSWSLPTAPAPLPPCPSSALVTGEPQPPCIAINPYHRFLDTTAPVPMTPTQKAYLAFHNFRDPGNIITIVGTAAFTVDTNSHTAYGPGFGGFLRDTGYSFSQDVTGEFFGTFLIPSLFHEDPHYHREPGAPFRHRLVHALSRTIIAQHDDGSSMPNYAVLFTYPISAEISNLYVPGVHGNGPSTVERIATGLATDPVNNLITEFLPDVARHINTRAIFIQRIVNMVTAGNAQMGMP
ncbi:hypothetical protein [Granulicella sibirica]|uniref:Uncharacterized protein n=1 Tax=Granulicella sibirica TaxID=2479048 RepID=A0A4V1L6D3_9BACT|nr:hypothetical protein [Granulicella sibirica]RXH58864.1 hypothetical protein GRAN_2174 [Granulicella sibirica]